MSKVLTARAVEATKPDPKKRREVPDGGLPGLYLVVQISGSKGWAVRYRHNGKPRKLTLGKYPLLSLAEARDKARDVLAAAGAGDDPAAEKRTRRGADTVEALVADFMARYGSKKKSGAETQRIFERDVLPVWGDRKAEDITRRDVIDLLDRIVDRGAPYMANRVLAAIRKLYSWAVSRDRLQGSPCAGVKPPMAERARDRILTDDEVRWFWQATGEIGFPFGPLFRLLLLTGQRRDEVGQMRWAELDGASWSIPGSRTKNGEPQLVHLSDPVLVALASMPRIKGSRFAFTTNGETAVSGFSRAKARLDNRMAELAGTEVPHWKLHDLRRTASSGMARCGVDLVVAEKALNHISGSLGGIAGVYNRYTYADEMRRAWEAWAALLVEIVGEDGGAVVPFIEAEK